MDPANPVEPVQRAAPPAALAPNQFFNRYVKNSVVLEEAYSKGKMWKYDFNEVTQTVEEKTGFDAVKAWFSSWFSPKDYPQHHYREIATKNYQQVLSAKNLNASQADQEYTPDSRALKIARIATSRITQTADPRTNRTPLAEVDQAINNYVQFIGQQRRSETATLANIVTNRTWQKIHPLSVEGIDVRIRRNINEHTFPVIRKYYRKVYVETTELYHSVKGRIPAPRQLDPKGLVNREEFILGERLYKKNLELASRINEECYGQQAKGQIQNLLRGNEIEKLPTEFLLIAIERAKETFPEYFENFSLDQMEVESYQFALIRQILTGGDMTLSPNQFARLLEGIKVAPYVDLGIQSLPYADLHAQFQREAGQVEGSSPTLAQLNQAYLILTQNHPSIIEKAKQRTEHGEYSIEGAQGMREAAYILSKIMWGAAVPRRAIVDGMFFNVRGNERLVYPFTMQPSDGINMLEHHLRSQKFQTVDQFRLSVEMMRAIPRNELAQLGLRYQVNPENPRQIRIGSMNLEIPSYMNLTNDNAVELLVHSQVQLFQEYLDHIESFQNTFNDPQFARISEVLKTYEGAFKDVNDLINKSHVLDPGLEQAIRAKAKERLLDEDKAVEAARRLGQVHLLLVVNLIQKEHRMGEYLGNFFRDNIGRPPVLPFTLCSANGEKVEVFSFHKMELEDYDRYGHALANHYFSHLISLNNVQVEQLIARNRKIAAITHLPNPLTAEQLGTLLCGKRAISAIERTRLNSLLGALKFTPEQLHALRDKTGLSDAQLQSLLIFQTAQLMLFVNQSLPPLTNDPPMGTLDNLTLKLSTLTIRNQFPNFSTALEPSTLEIDSSMSSIDYRSGYRFCSPEPLGRVNWEMAIKLDPDAPTSFRSAVDNNFQVTPVGVGSVAPLAQELRL